MNIFPYTTALKSRHRVIGRLARLLVVAISLTACSSLPVIVNVKSSDLAAKPPPLQETKPEGVVIFLAVSGGGSRAAAFSYGVINELQGVRLQKACNKRPCNIMDEVQYLSGVSGGAIIAAYYASLKNPFAEFHQFRDKFLYADNQSALIKSFLYYYYTTNPLGDPFAKLGIRSYVAGRYFHENLFEGKTFGDLPSKPFLIINSTDLVTGRRFTFTNEQFRCLGSDISRYPLGYAVAASASLPVAFATIRLDNYLDYPGSCFSETELSTLSVEEERRARQITSPHQDVTQSSLRPDIILRQRYLDHMATQHLHLSDGGLSDNLGLQSFRDIQSLLFNGIVNGTIKGVILISINAATDQLNEFGNDPASPNFIDVLTRSTDLLLQRATGSTQNEVAKDITQIQSALKRTDKKVPFVCLSISFDDIEEESLRMNLNSIPTRLSLPPNQIDTLIATGKFIVRKKANFTKAIQTLIENPDKFDAETTPPECRSVFQTN